MRAFLDKLRAVAPTRSTVLLAGESGTGKGVYARLVHELSGRADGPFVAIQCSAIPDALLESELFGHEKGAFTGADRARRGRFETASGGTLFLDEVATLPLAMQVKLLTVLQERRVRRLGSEEERELDVRLVAATNEDLSRLVAEGRFRTDLFYRLAVFPLEVPPLRERREDIPLIAAEVLARLGPRGGEPPALDPALLEAFERYHWPGNVRELENVIERALILEPGGVVRLENLPLEISATLGGVAPLPVDTRRTLSEVRRLAAEAAERAYLERVLSECRGRIAESAAAAGITPRQLHKLMTRHGLKKEAFRGGRD